MKRLLERALEVFLILGIMYLATGCATIKGACQDSAWLLQKGADNIQAE